MDASSRGQLSFNLNLDPSAQISTQQLPDDKLDQQKRNLHTTVVVVDEQFKNQEGGNMNMNMNMMEVISRRVERESRRMTQMVADMFDKCSVMHHQLVDLILNPDNPINKIKRKAEHTDDDNHDGSCCNKRIRMINCNPKITTTFIRVDPSDAGLAVKDGYQWRKYGQKVTRDNPSPRAYFKCSFAPICPVKKKVQKSVEDPTVVVATYEGEHNHKQQQQPSTNTIHSSLINPSPSSYISSPSSSSSSSSLKELRGGDIINEEDNDDDRVRRPLEHWLLHQMASSLTQDPSFTSTLAAAISHKLVLEQTYP